MSSSHVVLEWLQASLGCSQELESGDMVSVGLVGYVEIGRSVDIYNRHLTRRKMTEGLRALRHQVGNE